MAENDFDDLIIDIRKDKSILDDLLTGITTGRKSHNIRYNSFQALTFISEEYPELLYDKWDFFIDLIKSENSSSRMAALHVISNLTKIDTKNKFEKIINYYFNLLDDEKISVAMHAAYLSCKIAKYKPKLQTKITNKLLDIDKINHNLERLDLMKSYILDGFKLYFDAIKDKKKIFKFAEELLTSKSPKTRKLAKDFLEEYSK